MGVGLVQGRGRWREGAGLEREAERRRTANRTGHYTSRPSADTGTQYSTLYSTVPVVLYNLQLPVTLVDLRRVKRSFA